ncbi:hypothetical protein BC828DRAFT_379408 [Blastocladiella britannica]|nr:hypothetical protein BC828DRAFT_379408 [Blastocladiella britannica]
MIMEHSGSHVPGIAASIHVRWRWRWSSGRLHSVSRQLEPSRAPMGHPISRHTWRHVLLRIRECRRHGRGPRWMVTTTARWRCSHQVVGTRKAGRKVVVRAHLLHHHRRRIVGVAQVTKGSRLVTVMRHGERVTGPRAWRVAPRGGMSGCTVHRPAVETSCQRLLLLLHGRNTVRIRGTRWYVGWRGAMLRPVPVGRLWCGGKRVAVLARREV